MRTQELLQHLQQEQAYLPSTVKQFNICGIDFFNTEEDSFATVIFGHRMYQGQANGLEYYVIYAKGELSMVSTVEIEAEKLEIRGDMSLEEMNKMLRKMEEKSNQDTVHLKGGQPI